MSPSEPPGHDTLERPPQGPSPTPEDWLLLCRTVRFGDTDAAGVMHFHQLLRWCHVAYEESLERFGVASGAIFPGPGRTPAVALPIVHVSADFLSPLSCGDPLAIELRPLQRDGGSFEIRYRFLHGSKEAATGITRHVAIEAISRQRTTLPGSVSQWLEASRPDA
ncbi:thioesterase family protein [Synechococcus sp. CS-1332]|uniref:acyl-CoA thioesterase n=1 Tax=Synechococcus sp. CS-1332 TaxID=2847972 RepID=UPI00223B0F05|nr:acyl-CoA thioesterase [Synechococcus sp. CS-1332]MCT0207408.1 acyl-CoA thioesterase [Synechococcus sp. CS-1332]